MHKLRLLIRKIHTPITIMLVPHTRFSARSIRIPFILALAFCAFSCLGLVYTASLTVQAFDYYRMKKQYTAMSRQFNEMESTMASLKQSESQFRKLFSLGSRKEVLSNLPTDDGGSIDVEALKKQITESVESVQEIKSYLAKQHDVFQATPHGWPATGEVSSGFGMREHPLYGGRKFHTGIDITLSKGTPLHATADGVVSFAGRNAGNGNIVVIEHGYGFSSVYAHNSKNLARPGQTVKRGEVIAHSGSTGASTGPHVHYEVWKNGQSVNPKPFIEASN
ncbi:M23 family metallopeptidase [Geomobilimonas luticola]|uniref:M23 family metallopeptidase n=1 Tax=Geomobilimonas luticola TaxID=1114878 RepID=A0ABS5SBI5_9BACT|nr:M23 family metallopeptidase [Geomobilimonas luticola]MBT0652728.1 M23 family metallopeptidase [Geomobilimonas luticola]